MKLPEASRSKLSFDRVRGLDPTDGYRLKMGRSTLDRPLVEMRRTERLGNEKEYFIIATDEPLTRKMTYSGIFKTAKEAYQHYINALQSAKDRWSHKPDLRH